MKSTFRCLLACALCILVPAMGQAGPLGDALRKVSAQQTAPSPAKRRQGIWVGGIVLTGVGGGMMLVGASQKKPCEEGDFFTTCQPMDPNAALIGAGAAAVGAGIIMIFMGRSKAKAAPQIIATPGRLATQYTLKF